MSRLARRNPFASTRMHSLPYRAPGFCIENISIKFRELNRRAALVGMHGHGKSTLLEQITALFRASGETILRIQLREGDRRLDQNTRCELTEALGRYTLVILDGAEQLSLWNWRRFLQSLPSETGCLITSHRPGRLPTLWRCETTLDLLLELVEDLQGPVSSEQQALMAGLFASHRGDMRLCLRSLYDYYADGIWTPIRDEMQ